jgi:hypothetical protein
MAAEQGEFSFQLKLNKKQYKQLLWQCTTLHSRALAVAWAAFFGIFVVLMAAALVGSIIGLTREYSQPWLLVIVAFLLLVFIFGVLSRTVLNRRIYIWSQARRTFKGAPNGHLIFRVRLDRDSEGDYISMHEGGQDFRLRPHDLIGVRQTPDWLCLITRYGESNAVDRNFRYGSNVDLWIPVPIALSQLRGMKRTVVLAEVEDSPILDWSFISPRDLIDQVSWRNRHGLPAMAPGKASAKSAKGSKTSKGAKSSKSANLDSFFSTAVANERTRPAVDINGQAKVAPTRPSHPLDYALADERTPAEVKRARRQARTRAALIGGASLLLSVAVLWWDFLSPFNTDSSLNSDIRRTASDLTNLATSAVSPNQNATPSDDQLKQWATKELSQDLAVYTGSPSADVVKALSPYINSVAQSSGLSPQDCVKAWLQRFSYQITQVTTSKSTDWGKGNDQATVIAEVSLSCVQASAIGLDYANAVNSISSSKKDSLGSAAAYQAYCAKLLRSCIKDAPTITRDLSIVYRYNNGVWTLETNSTASIVNAILTGDPAV